MLQLNNLGYKEMAGTYTCTVTSVGGQSSGSKTLEVYCKSYCSNLYIKKSFCYETRGNDQSKAESVSVLKELNVMALLNVILVLFNNKLCRYEVFSCLSFYIIISKYLLLLLDIVLLKTKY